MGDSQFSFLQLKTMNSSTIIIESNQIHRTDFWNNPCSESTKVWIERANLLHRLTSLATGIPIEIILSHPMKRLFKSNKSEIELTKIVLSEFTKIDNQPVILIR